MPASSVLVAVDTNVLFDEELGDEDVIDALGTIRERVKDARFVVTPTVVQEIAYAAISGDDAGKRRRNEYGKEFTETCI